MRRRLVIAAGVGLLLVAGYLLAVVFIPREHSPSPTDPDPVIVDTTVTLTRPAAPADSKTYGAQAVASSLRKHGFEVDVVFDRSGGDRVEGTVLGLLGLYSELEDIDALIADSSLDGAIGSEISAWVFDTSNHADSFRATSGAQLQRRNVVVITRAANEAAASAALDDLG
jgi:hypothetical protein